VSTEAAVSQESVAGGNMGGSGYGGDTVLELGGEEVGRGGGREGAGGVARVFIGRKCGDILAKLAQRQELQLERNKLQVALQKTTTQTRSAAVTPRDETPNLSGTAFGNAAVHCNTLQHTASHCDTPIAVSEWHTVCAANMGGADGVQGGSVEGGGETAAQKQTKEDKLRATVLKAEVSSPKSAVWLYRMYQHLSTSMNIYEHL